MKTLILIVGALMAAACGAREREPAAETSGVPPPATATTATTTTGTAAKTVAEKAFDAGMRGKQKAEQINAGQAERAAEVDEAGQ